MTIKNEPGSVSIGAESQTHVVSMDGEKPQVSAPEEVTSTDLSEAEAAALEGDDTEEGSAGAEEGDPAEGEGDEGSEEGEEGDSEEGSAEELPDFDPANEEVVAKYDAKYANEDGTLNLDAFNAELAANETKNGKPDINEGSRKYLKEAYGVSDALIDRHIEGLVAIRAAQEKAFYEKVGGEEAYNEMLAWAGTEAGYTQAQKDRFNAAIQKGGEEAEEQLELLKTRFAAENPKAGGEEQDTNKGSLRNRRRSSPKKSASGTTAAPAVTGYATPEDHRVALNEAKGDPKKLEAVRAKLRASKWFQA